MNGLEETIGTNGFNGFWSINHWPRWFFSLATIGLDGFAMVFGLTTIGLNGFSMVANHWSNDGIVTIHCYGLERSITLHHGSCHHFHQSQEPLTCLLYNKLIF